MGDKIFDSIISNVVVELDGSVFEINFFVMLDSVIVVLKMLVVDSEVDKEIVVVVLDKINCGLKNLLNNVLIVCVELGMQLNELELLDLLGSDCVLG